MAALLLAGWVHQARAQFACDSDAAGESGEGADATGSASNFAGGYIAAGESVMFIVPEQDELIFEAQVNPSAIDRVEIGQKSIIHLHAFDPGVLPELAGMVMRISPDSITDTQTSMPYYVVVGRTRTAGTTGASAKHARGSIIETEARTELRYLLKPLSDRVVHIFRER